LRIIVLFVVCTYLYPVYFCRVFSVNKGFHKSLGPQLQLRLQIGGLVRGFGYQSVQTSNIRTRLNLLCGGCRAQEDPVSFSADLVCVTGHSVGDAVRWVQSLTPTVSSVTDMALCHTINAALKLANVSLITAVLIVVVVIAN